MPRVLWCNLDPDWPFARMLHDHCLDWVAREDIWVWDVREPPAAMQAPWDEWPRLIAPGTLSDTFDELPPAPGGERLLALHLPRQLGADDPARTFLQMAAGRVAAETGWALILSLPEQADIASVPVASLGARLTARLSDDPRRRIQSQRLLIEMMLKSQLAADLARPDTPAIFDVTLEGERRQPVHDRAAGQWSAALPDALRQIGAMQQPVAARAGEQDTFVEQTLVGVAALREATAPPRDGLPTPMPVPMQVRVPRYLDPNFADGLRAARVTFLEQLDREMNLRWHALEAWRAKFMDACDVQDERLDRELAKVSVMDVGFSDSGRDRLDAWRERLSKQLQATASGSEALAREISRDVRQPGANDGDGYVRHRFAEDDEFDDAIETAIRVSAGLVQRSVIVSGWLWVTLAAAIPVLMMRLPGWLDGGPQLTGALPGGIQAYLATPALWLFDLGWVLLPGAVLWVGGLIAAGRRRRALGEALQQVQQRAEALWQRHAKVLDHMALYIGHTAAMRRLMRLRVHLQRLDHGVRSGRAALVSMQHELERQRRDYRQIGVPQPPKPPKLDAELADAMGEGGSPLRWLIALASDMPTGAPVSVRIDDHRMNRADTLDTSYLTGQATLRLEQVASP